MSMSKQAPAVWIIDGKHSKSTIAKKTCWYQTWEVQCAFAPFTLYWTARQKKDTASNNMHTIDGRQLKRVASIIIDYKCCQETFIDCLLAWCTERRSKQSNAWAIESRRKRKAKVSINQWHKARFRSSELQNYGIVFCSIIWKSTSQCAVIPRNMYLCDSLSFASSIHFSVGIKRKLFQRDTNFCVLKWFFVKFCRPFSLM